MAAALHRTARRQPILTAIAAVVLALCLLSTVSARNQTTVADRPAEAISVAQPSSADIRALDTQVQVILAEARRQQELLAVQRERLDRAEAANAWLPWLAAGLVGLAGLAGWLGLRLWRLQRTRTAVPEPAAAEPPSASELTAIDMAALVAAAMPDSAPAQLSRRPVPAMPGNVQAAAGPAARPAPSPSPSPSTQSAPAPSPVQTMAAAPRLTPLQRDRSGMPLSTRDFSMGSHVQPRPVSVEELLDLDQQVDFFLALGQAQSAIDLLLSHVRGSGGTSALPYFKLLEIYREQGDEEAYERTRERFNQRFNAHAPDWAAELAGGRMLEDYPEVMQRLQRAWPQPIRAVAEMEGLLLRRADLEPFDLPAYRELLMLHALVRDLPSAPLAATATTPAVLNIDPEPEPAAAPVEAVDLLLPIGEEPLDVTAPRPHVADASSAQTLLADWVFTRAVQARRAAGVGGGPVPLAQPTIKLDLDLSDYAPAPREFTRPAAFTDIDMRRDKRLSDLGGLDGFDSDPTPLPSRR